MTLSSKLPFVEWYEDYTFNVRDCNSDLLSEQEWTFDETDFERSKIETIYDMKAMIDYLRELDKPKNYLNFIYDLEFQELVLKIVKIWIEDDYKMIHKYFDELKYTVPSEAKLENFIAWMITFLEKFNFILKLKHFHQIKLFISQKEKAFMTKFVKLKKGKEEETEKK